MFINDKLIFLELHKTAGTHIGRLLSEFAGGEQIGKHNQADPEHLGSNRIFLGSIRNPWEWYVSLWAYGCTGQGAVYRKVTSRRHLVLRNMGWNFRPWEAFHLLIRRNTRRPERWRKTYTDVNAPENFRDWLRMMHDPLYWDDFREGYATSGLAGNAGLLTYRFVRLFCQSSESSLDLAGLNTQAGLRDYVDANCFINYFIRNENLEEDFIAAMVHAGIDLSAEQQLQIRSAGKTNSSSRSESAEFYFDRATSKLVMDRERVIIEKFGYSPPSIP